MLLFEIFYLCQWADFLFFGKAFLLFILFSFLLLLFYFLHPITLIFITYLFLSFLLFFLLFFTLFLIILLLSLLTFDTCLVLDADLILILFFCKFWVLNEAVVLLGLLFDLFLNWIYFLWKLGGVATDDIRSHDAIEYMVFLHHFQKYAVSILLIFSIFHHFILCFLRHFLKF